MKRILAIIALLIGSSPIASAAWQTGSFVDRMTEKKYAYAELPAKDGGATLYVGCMNGRVQPDIQFPSRVGYGELGSRCSITTTMNLYPRAKFRTGCAA